MTEGVGEMPEVFGSLASWPGQAENLPAATFTTVRRAVAPCRTPMKPKPPSPPTPSVVHLSRRVPADHLGRAPINRDASRPV